MQNSPTMMASHFPTIGATAAWTFTDATTAWTFTDATTAWTFTGFSNSLDFMQNLWKATTARRWVGMYFLQRAENGGWTLVSAYACTTRYLPGYLAPAYCLVVSPSKDSVGTPYSVLPTSGMHSVRNC